MYLRVEKAKYVPRYKVDIEFNDGARRIVDFEPFLKKAQNPMFTKYRRLKHFKSFHIDHGDLMWGDFELIFPILDLYRGTILKSEQPAWQLNEGVSRRKFTPARSISYRKTPKRKKHLQHV
jgi:Protein of unknown function (DUF2442)